MARSLESELESFISGIGFELVALERGGGRKRPLLRIRVDRPDAPPGRSGVTLDDCAEVSRAVERFLESRGQGEEQWILEVSSPGVERPLTKPGDYERFAGQRVRLRGYRPIQAGSRSLEGRLLGLRVDGGGREVVEVELGSERVSVPLSDIARATLAFEFADEF